MLTLTHRIRRGLFFIAVAGIAVSGCDSSDPEPGGGDGNGAGPLAPGEVVYDVEYKPGVAVVEGDLLDALVSADTAQHRYVFDADALADAGLNLADGTVVLLAGYDLGRVVSAAESGGQVTVLLEPVPLTEAIESGRVGWNLALEFTPESVGRMTVGGHTGRRIAASDTVEWEYESGDFTMNIKIVPHGDYADILTQFVKGEGNNLTARLSGEGRVEGINSLVDAIYEGGELEDFSFENTDLAGQMDLELIAAASGSAGLDFEMPEFAVQWPIPPNVMPIPSTIGVGVQFVASLTVAPMAQARITTGLSFSGDAGFQLGEQQVVPISDFEEPDFSGGSFDSSAMFGVPVDAQAGVAFPRVSLNVLNQEVAYVLTGMTVGSKLTWGPICKEGYTRLLVQGGYKLEVMGFSIAEGDTVLVDRQQRVSQNDCAEDGDRPALARFVRR